MANQAGDKDVDSWVRRFRVEYPELDYTWINFRTMFEMLQAAINKSGPTGPMQMALALDGMEGMEGMEGIRAHGRPRHEPLRRRSM